eukprot:Nitzschia sp. Nitz4//scaffold52_size167869//128393//129298//NITZ4_002289-RA/size167869-processed-gene-0.174-mRNA-1//-1//CDS//3329554074//8811//frame0
MVDSSESFGEIAQSHPNLLVTLAAAATQDNPWSRKVTLRSSKLFGTGLLRHGVSLHSLRTSTKQCGRASMSYTIPIVLESGAMGERSFDIYSRLLRERIICVHGEVTDQMSSVVTAQLLFLEAEAPEKPIYMYINSPGGSVTAGLAMYDTMQYVRPQIHTIAMGQAASMGSLLLAGGSPGCRMTLPNARIMLHQPSGGAQGMASDIEITAREILRLRSRLNKLYVHHTGQTLEAIENVMDRDTFMDASQAKDFGVVDTILDRREPDDES